MKKDIRLSIYQAKKGWKWRFIINGDIQCIGTNHFKSQEDALQHAKDTLMLQWEIIEPPPKSEEITFDV